MMNTLEKKAAVIVEKSLQCADGTRIFCGDVVSVFTADGKVVGETLRWIEDSKIEVQHDSTVDVIPIGTIADIKPGIPEDTILTPLQAAIMNFAKAEMWNASLEEFIKDTGTSEEDAVEALKWLKKRNIVTISGNGFISPTNYGWKVMGWEKM